MNRRFAIIALVSLAAVLIVGGAVTLLSLARPHATSQGAALVGGPFQLVNQDGATVDEKILQGKWSAVFFGYTYCPDFCPTTLQSLGQAEALLGPRAKDFQAVFISVDPERDTPSQMKLYLSADGFPKHLVGLSGTQAQVDAAAKAYRVFHQKNGEGSSYLMDHSTITYLMSPKGRFVCALPYGLPPDQLAERITKAMREGPDAEAC